MVDAHGWQNWVDFEKYTLGKWTFTLPVQFNKGIFLHSQVFSILWGEKVSSHTNFIYKCLHITHSDEQDHLEEQISFPAVQHKDENTALLKNLYQNVEILSEL